ncbi:hypothetical protein FMN63_06440 [Stappia sp. BW2]|uniref:hypothetical protein n=1 Tax=Stappia sp. BW2 TaxID=2592622 RepID=UPI0011DEC74E|nr:hypothetical protein [Stappia sp. BW2]TYC75483.1 hypothetical protein FMN63_06440 [Stappia sp. BW2]
MAIDSGATIASAIRAGRGKGSAIVRRPDVRLAPGLKAVSFMVAPNFFSLEVSPGLVVGEMKESCPNATGIRLVRVVSKWMTSS